MKRTKTLQSHCRWILKKYGAFGVSAQIYRNGVIVRHEELYKGKKVEIQTFFRMPIYFSVHNKAICSTNNGEVQGEVSRIVCSNLSYLAYDVIKNVNVSAFGGSQNTNDDGIAIMSVSIDYQNGGHLCEHILVNRMAADFSVIGTGYYTNRYCREEEPADYEPEYTDTVIDSAT